jgi:BirA family transcriptional regulator, biotin operon repressor / biotin---[acetyl-CoA-carboxylase] ligase
LSRSTVTEFLARRKRFAVVGSTNDVVRAWLAEGTPEVCLAVADEQSAGRGRDGRRWIAPPGAALLLSLGFRPTWLPPERVWRLAAIVSMAMAEAAERAASMSAGSIRLKWPNDLVVEADSGIRKLGGVLGESDGLGSDDPRVVIGIGLNGDWPLDAFPTDLADTMTSLRVLAGGRVDHDQLLGTFLERLEPQLHALRDGAFDADGWTARQVTTGRWVRLELPDGDVMELPAIGVDAGRSGALIVIDPAVPDVHRLVLVGDIQNVRLAATMAPGV